MKPSNNKKIGLEQKIPVLSNPIIFGCEESHGDHPRNPKALILKGFRPGLHIGLHRDGNHVIFEWSKRKICKERMRMIKIEK